MFLCSARSCDGASSLPVHSWQHRPAVLGGERNRDDSGHLWLGTDKSLPPDTLVPASNQPPPDVVWRTKRCHLYVVVWVPTNPGGNAVIVCTSHPPKDSAPGPFRRRSSLYGRMGILVHDSPLRHPEIYQNVQEEREPEGVWETSHIGGQHC